MYVRPVGQCGLYVFHAIKIFLLAIKLEILVDGVINKHGTNYSVDEMIYSFPCE